MTKMYRFLAFNKDHKPVIIEKRAQTQENAEKRAEKTATQMGLEFIGTVTSIMIGADHIK